MARATYGHTELDEEVFSLLKTRGLAPAVIFDVGASNASWSRAIAKIFPDAEYHLFEPLVDHSPEYGRLMAEALGTHPNFRLHKCALGARNGPTSMNVLPNVVASTALQLTDDEIPGVVQTSVPMLTLDHAIRTFELPTPQIIKIDTQGCELEILKGSRGTLPDVAVLLLECWLYRGYGLHTPLLTELAAWLLQFDFRLWDLAGDYRNEQGVLTSVDCVFVNTRAGLTPHWYYA